MKRLLIFAFITAAMLQGCTIEKSRNPNQRNVIGYDTINDYTFSIVCNKAGIAYYSSYSSVSNNAVLAPVVDENGFVKCSTIRGSK